MNAIFVTPISDIYSCIYFIDASSGWLRFYFADTTRLLKTVGRTGIPVCLFESQWPGQMKNKIADYDVNCVKLLAKLPLILQSKC